MNSDSKKFEVDFSNAKEFREQLEVLKEYKGIAKEKKDKVLLDIVSQAQKKLQSKKIKEANQGVGSEVPAPEEHVNFSEDSKSEENSVISVGEGMVELPLEEIDEETKEMLQEKKEKEKRDEFMSIVHEYCYRRGIPINGHHEKAIFLTCYENKIINKSKFCIALFRATKGFTAKPIVLKKMPLDVRDDMSKIIERFGAAYKKGQFSIPSSDFDFWNECEKRITNYKRRSRGLPPKA